MKPGKLQRNKQRSQNNIGRSTAMHDLLFCAYTLWLNYIPVAFLLVSTLGSNHDLLCFVHGQDQNNEQKH